METGERALPEDIRKLAYELAYEGSMPPLAASAERIAAALLAERERCAKIAEESQIAGDDAPTLTSYNMACEQIAAAIRS